MNNLSMSDLSYIMNSFETKKLLNQIIENGNLTLAKDKAPAWQKKAIDYGSAGITGLATAAVVAFFTHLNGSPQGSFIFPMMLGSGSQILRFGADKLRFPLRNRLQTIITNFKNNTNQNGIEIANKLETIKKAAINYALFSSYDDVCLGATLLASAASVRLGEMDYLPKGVSVALLATGIVGTAALSRYQYMNKGLELQKVNQKVSQKVDECLKMLEDPTKKLQMSLINA